MDRVGWREGHVRHQDGECAAHPVDAKRIIHVDWFRRLNLNSVQQLPHAAHARQVGFTAGAQAMRSGLRRQTGCLATRRGFRLKQRYSDGRRRGVVNRRQPRYVGQTYDAPFDPDCRHPRRWGYSTRSVGRPNVTFHTLAHLPQMPFGALCSLLLQRTLELEQSPF